MGLFDIPNDAAVDLGTGVFNEVEENAEDSAQGNEDRQEVHEVPQLQTDLTHDEMEEVFRERWNRDPGECFCKNPGKHPEPVVVAKGYIKGRRSVFDTSRRSCYQYIDQIKAFLGSHESVDATHSELKELGDLELTLRKQWGYIKLMVTSENPAVLCVSDNVVSAKGQAVEAALACTGQFIRESVAESSGVDVTRRGTDLQIHDDCVAPDIVRKDSVVAESVIPESTTQGDTRKTGRASVVDESTVPESTAQEDTREEGR